jgi:hypothetical protein
VFAQQPGPDLDVPILDLGQAPIEVALARVGFGVGEEPVQVRGVRLVLPVMLECVQVGSGRSAHDRKLGGIALGAIAVCVW